MYYLQSRYYDPEIGRFIHADSYASTGQGFLGYNMFAYCGNNPICRIDPVGNSWWNNPLDRAKSRLEEQKEKAAKNDKTGTMAYGITGLAAFGASATASFATVWDKKGNTGIMLTFGGGGGTPSAGFGAFFTYTNAPTIDKLNGVSSQYGGSGSYLVSIGGEFTMFEDSSSDKVYTGGTVTVGIGVSPIVAEAHSDLTNSWVWQANFYDVASVFLDLLYVR